jgi:hypothetical protein
MELRPAADLTVALARLRQLVALQQTMLAEVVVAPMAVVKHPD